jgi:hypothetical protein
MNPLVKVKELPQLNQPDEYFEGELILFAEQGCRPISHQCRRPKRLERADLRHDPQGPDVAIVQKYNQ